MYWEGTQYIQVQFHTFKNVKIIVIYLKLMLNNVRN